MLICWNLKLSNIASFLIRFVREKTSQHDFKSPILSLKNIYFYILWKKCRLNSTFLPSHVKKNHSTHEVHTFKVMPLLSYLTSLNDKPRT